MCCICGGGFYANFAEEETEEVVEDETEEVDEDETEEVDEDETVEVVEDGTDDEYTSESSDESFSFMPSSDESEVSSDWSSWFGVDADDIPPINLDKLHYYWVDINKIYR